MKFLYSAVIISCFLIKFAQSADPSIEEDELRARAFMLNLNNVILNAKHVLYSAIWKYETNITDFNQKKMLKAQSEFSKILKENWIEVKKVNWQNFNDPDLKRKFKLYSEIGDSALSEKHEKKLNKGLAEMKNIYSTAKICKFNDPKKCDLELDPDIQNIFEKSDNPEELKHIWLEWHNAVGPKVKHIYKDYVDLKNEAARLNNYTDYGAQWLGNYETTDILDQISNLWNQLKPLYLQIHAYVRNKLMIKYGNKIVSKDGPIPAHLLGNMWAQSWNVYEFTAPFPNRSEPNIDEMMVEQGYDAKKIMKTAENFFTSINLSPMPEEFWNKSVISKVDGLKMVCHASAWDMFKENDVRIKQCTSITYESLLISHHEMGHIEYYLQYKNQPVIYREGANEGFHEAVGDTISLSTSTRKYLQFLGLLNDTDSDSKADENEASLNNLYKIALTKIVFLPFSYSIDRWRWDVFSGKTTSNEYNRAWWKLREEIQGVSSPVKRTEEDFDIASKYHVISDTPYIRYFVSFVIQFQFQRALCIKAGEYNPHNPHLKPLHECSIYGSHVAGDVLKKMLQMGYSRPWPDAMEVITGQRILDASALLEYFKPLSTWLEKENKRNDVHIGWHASHKG